MTRTHCPTSPSQPSLLETWWECGCLELFLTNLEGERCSFWHFLSWACQVLAVQWPLDSISLLFYVWSPLWDQLGWWPLMCYAWRSLALPIVALLEWCSMYSFPWGTLSWRWWHTISGAGGPSVLFLHSVGLWWGSCGGGYNIAKTFHDYMFLQHLNGIMHCVDSCSSTYLIVWAKCPTLPTVMHYT